jgi:hypothetical protein
MRKKRSGVIVGHLGRCLLTIDPDDARGIIPQDLQNLPSWSSLPSSVLFLQVA